MESLNPFPEIEEFVEECRKFYGVDMRVIQGPIRQVLEEITSTHPSLKAVFMGNRRSDPWCDKLSVFKVVFIVSYQLTLLLIHSSTLIRLGILLKSSLYLQIFHVEIFKSSNG